MTSIPELKETFRKGTEHLRFMAQKLEFPWNPDENDQRALHNNYARSLITCYVSRFSDLSEGLLDAVDKQNYLIYALSGRALIENVATLRYYVRHEYKPLFDKGAVMPGDMRRLIEIDDRHLRGSRFDWQSFIYQRYSKLKDDTVKSLEDKKKKIKSVVNGMLQEQRNVVTCVERWADEIPEVLIAYNLFCDLVHPNIGSAFLVASISKEGLYFSRLKGEPVGKQIFEQSFPILLSVLKSFPTELTFLMATVWRDEELAR